MENLLLFSLQSVAVYILVIACLRVLGKKGLAELSIADLVLIILIAEPLGALIPEENKFWGTIICILTLTAANYFFEWMIFKSKKFRDLVEGTPIILIRKGKIITKNMKKENVTLENLKESIRSNGLKDISDVDLGILETDGEISIIPKDSEEK